MSARLTHEHDGVLVALHPYPERYHRGQAHVIEMDDRLPLRCSTDELRTLHALLTVALGIEPEVIEAATPTKLQELAAVLHGQAAILDAERAGFIEALRERAPLAYARALADARRPLHELIARTR